MKKQQNNKAGAAETHIVTCPTCGTRYRTENAPARKVQCSRCGTLFYDWHYPNLVGQGYKAFWNFKGRYAIVKGSRGSKKSKTIALWIIANMMQYPEANTLIVRKTERTLKDSCFSDLRWAIHRLGADAEWKCTTNPLEITRPVSGQKILFRGLDDPLKITSISVPHGVLCWVWFEEFYEITKESDFDMIDESIRGEMPDGYFKHILGSLNPWNDKHWIKKRFFDSPNTDEKLALTTTYKVNEWLDDSDRKLFETMKKNNPLRYRVAGLGEWGVAEGLIFENWEEKAFDVDAIRRERGMLSGFGLDFGFTIDPSALCCFMVDNRRKIVYIFDELYERGLTNSDLARRIKEMGYAKERIVADAAEPKSIEELRREGIINIRPCRKGQDSIRNGISLCQEYKIIIHPRCVNFLTEISNYRWSEDKFGNRINKPVDDFNHEIDGWRYGMMSVCQGDRFSWD